MGTNDRFPARKGGAMLRTLKSKPLCYRVERQKGSHRRLVSPHHPPITFAFHDKDTVPSGVVREILVKEVGLTVEEARELV